MVDRQHASQENDQIAGLIRDGFDVRCNSLASMHNKYCIVDERVMISGSLNWTHTAFSSNDEMINWNYNREIVGKVASKFLDCFRAGYNVPN